MPEYGKFREYSKDQLIKELDNLQMKYEELKRSYQKHISEKSFVEESLLNRTDLLYALNQFSLELGDLEGEKLFQFIADKFKKVFKVRAVGVCIYHELEAELEIVASTISTEDNSAFVKHIGRKINNFRVKVSEESYDFMMREIIKTTSSLNVLSFGQIPEIAGSAIEKLLRTGWFMAVSLVDNGELFGSLVIAGNKGQEEPKNDIVAIFAELSSSILRRKQAEAKFLFSENKFKSAFFTSPDSINISRLSDGMYVSVNKGFTRISGYTEEEVIGRTSIELNIWVDPNDRAKLVKGLLEKGEVENLDARFMKKSGAIIYGIMSAAIIDFNGIPHILSITRDISDRKEAENALIRSEKRFREMIDLAPDGILFGSSEGIILGANSRMLNLSDREPDELLGFNIEVLFESDELTRVPLRYDLLFKGKVIRNERNLLRPDGETIPVEMHSRMMPDGSFQSILHDITERKILEKTLRDNERFLMESQSVARLGSFVWDMSDGLWKSSKILDEIFGIDENFKRTLQGWEKLIHPKWKKIMDYYVKNDILGAHNKFDKEYLIIRQSDKQVRWVHGFAELELDAQDNPIRLIGTISDITSRKLVEEKLREQSEVLEQRVAERTAQLEMANKELEAFAYSVSHDLRAPLRAIDGFSKFLIDDPVFSLNQESVRLLNLIRSNTKKMDQLIIDILSLSRVSRSSLKKSRVDMRKMALSMLNEVAPSDIQNNLHIITDEMPEAYADSTYLKQVWINLISNAIKFSSGKSKPLIEFGGFKKGNFNVYYVRDNGVGFKTEYGHKLFGAFQRLHGADEFEGNGVGLAIVQRVIHRHEGKVWAKGKPGEGATFFFSLPSKMKN